MSVSRYFFSAGEAGRNSAVHGEESDGHLPDEP